MIHLQQYLTLQQQTEILQLCREVARESPLFTPTMKSGKSFNYQMTNCGDFGWVSNQDGYRYTKTHPITGKLWKPMPEIIEDLAKSLAAEIGEPDYLPETCLINYYQHGGKLGLHQDNTEKNLKPAIISISLGDDAIFLMGGKRRNDPTEEIILKSGDILMLFGDSRLAYHGIKKIIPGTSSLLKNGGRLNLTIRQVF